VFAIFIGLTNKGGHFAGLKLRRLENGHYAISVINHGAECDIIATSRKRPQR
jgi:hypothetical protein